MRARAPKTLEYAKEAHLRHLNMRARAPETPEYAKQARLRHLSMRARAFETPENAKTKSCKQKPTQEYRNSESTNSCVAMSQKEAEHLQLASATDLQGKHAKNKGKSIERAKAPTPVWPSR